VGVTEVKAKCLGHLRKPESGMQRSPSLPGPRSRRARGPARAGSPQPV